MKTVQINQNITNADEEGNANVFKTSNFIKIVNRLNLLKNANAGESVCDFGCGDGSLVELLYRNKVAPSRYVGLDSNPVSIEQHQAKWSRLKWTTFLAVNPCYGGTDYSTFLSVEADSVIAHNVPADITKADFYNYIQNFYMCGNPEAHYSLLLPRSIDQLSEQDIATEIETYFQITHRHGVNGSLERFIPFMNKSQEEFYKTLSAYYSNEILSAFLSPFFPDQCPQNLWTLKRKQQ